MLTVSVKSPLCQGRAPGQGHVNNNYGSLIHVQSQNKKNSQLSFMHPLKANCHLSKLAL